MKCVRSYWPDEDIAFFWEIAEDGWVHRAVELHGPDRRVKAAPALEEVKRARDSGGITAVIAYENR